jgi:FlaA1/EpsC-like NDP-sugar epimerase
MFQTKLANELLGLSRRKKRLLAISTDGFMCAAAAWGAHYLRLEQWIWLEGNQWLTILVSIVLALPIFIRLGLYRMIFRHTGVPAMLRVARACLLYGALYAFIFTFISLPGVPRTVGIIQPILLFLMIGASRAFVHSLLGSNYRRILNEGVGRRVLIYGAGASGRQLAEALAPQPGMSVAGFLDDDSSLHGALVDGLPVYDPDKLLQIASREEVAEVLLSVPSAARRRRREIIDNLLPAGIKVRTLPSLADIAHGEVEVTDIRPLQIEDLLGRAPVSPDPRLLTAKISGKVVLVTGAAGSIGSELCRQILEQEPSTLVLFDASEFGLYTIHRELEARRRSGGAPVELIPLVGSVQDRARIRAVICDWRPDTIYHAAAYKHVPLVESNALEGIKNNVFGTMELANAAREFDVADLVLISTDKAVRPTNVMGATKRLAEMVLQAWQEGAKTRFSMVRFGNVLGSSGSVVPLFREQIASGGPVTVTHPDVTRYFMTIPEAAQLVVQASAMASGGEVFVLDMGEPVKVYDMAVGMIELSGLSVRDAFNPDGDVEIAIVGLRPGEKLYEELLIGENPIPTDHERIMQARERFVPADELLPQLDRLDAAARASDLPAAMAILKTLVPEYRNPEAVAEQLPPDGTVEAARTTRGGETDSSAKRPEPRLARSEPRVGQSAQGSL